MRWTGFCFPKSCEKTCVSQVEVFWDEATLEFWFTYSCLEVGEVLDTIKSSLNSQIRKLTGFVVPLMCRFGLPLGEWSPNRQLLCAMENSSTSTLLTRWRISECSNVVAKTPIILMVLQSRVSLRASKEATWKVSIHGERCCYIPVYYTMHF